MKDSVALGSYGGQNSSSAASPAAGLYGCHPRPLNGYFLLNPRENTRSFQHMHLRHEVFSADGLWFRLEFKVNLNEKWRVTVHGRDLWPIYVNLHHHKIEWIRKADRDSYEDKGAHP